MHTVVYDYQTFTLQRFGGISRYVCEVAARVHRAPGFRARIVAPIHFNEYLSASAVPRFALNLHLSHPRLEPLNRRVCRTLSPWAIRAARPSLVHRTYFRSTFAPASVPGVVTVYDMIHEVFPEHFSPADPTSRCKRESVERADLVLCISHSTADDLVRLFDVPRHKIRVTYLGFSDVFARQATSAASPPPRPYLLYVGHRGGYKNFEAALRAYARSARLRDEFDFLFFGGFPIQRDEAALIDALGVRAGAVRRLSGSDEDLANAYRHAHVFVYPSKYEGFGIPPLEAMASGCPVACSNSSSIPEVVGSAAELFDPDDIAAIEHALLRLCFDNTRRAELIAAGTQRIGLFSWDRCGQATLEAYQALLGAPGSPNQ